MGLDEDEVGRCLQGIFGPYEDSFQEAWVKILEGKPQTMDEITSVARKVRNKEIKRYLETKYKEISLQEPLGDKGDGRFTLESILRSPAAREKPDEGDDGSTGLYHKMVDFLIEEYVEQKNQNLELKRREVHLKEERLRLREESLAFKRLRFESWRRLMEAKGEQKQSRSTLYIQLQREKLEFRKERLLNGQARGDFSKEKVCN
jgi:hypothetical protein